MPRYIYALLALFIVSACGSKEDDQGGDLLRIIGANDLKPIEASQRNSNIVKSIGRLNIGCTVTHVGNGLVVTAGHCFFDYPFDGKVEQQACDESKYDVEWGVLNGVPGYMVSKCQEIVAAEYRGGIDYTIFRAAPYPSEALMVSSAQHKRGDRISIFSHPRRRPLEWSGFCQIKGLSTYEGSQFGYECDTEGGSSGAAVLNERNEIIGIHNFYSSRDNLNGGTSIEKTPLAQLVNRLH